MAAFAFLLVRSASTSASLWLYDRSWTAELGALDRVPRGASLVTFVGTSCKPDWSTPRLEHLSGLAIVRREAYSNDQWTVAGSHLLGVKPPRTPFVDPSQMVAVKRCKGVTVEEALKTVRLGRFQYVWLIKPPAFDPEAATDWQLVWRQGSSLLFRVPD